jgi:hypothetical protein
VGLWATICQIPGVLSDYNNTRPLCMYMKGKFPTPVNGLSGKFPGVSRGGGWLLQELTHALYRCEPKASVIDECHCTIHASRKYVILAIEPRFCNCDVRLSDILFRRVYYLMILNEFWEYISNGYSFYLYIL